MNDRTRQVIKIYKQNKNKDVRLYCTIFLLGRIWK